MMQRISSPLSGQSVLITRSLQSPTSLQSALIDAGALCEIFPTIVLSPITPNPILVQAIEKISRFTFCVFTSAFGVETFFNQMLSLKKDVRSLYNCSICCIGTGTAAALLKYGLIPDYIPENFTVESLVKGMIHNGIESTDRILIPCSNLSRIDLLQKLDYTGAIVSIVPSYKTEPVIHHQDVITAIEEKITSGKITWVTFTSSSSVRFFLDEIPSAKLTCKSAAIGWQTAQTMRDLGIQPTVVAHTHTMRGLAQAILDFTTAHHA